MLPVTTVSTNTPRIACAASISHDNCTRQLASFKSQTESQHAVHTWDYALMDLGRMWRSWCLFCRTAASHECRAHHSHSLPPAITRHATHSLTHSLITRREASFAEYWIHFKMRFDGVHAFSYNSTGSEPIWRKFGALWVHCLPLALADFGRDLCRSNSERARQILFFFCQVSNAWVDRFPVGQLSWNLHTRCGPVSLWILSEQNCANLPAMGLFSKKANSGQKSSTTCNFRLWYLLNNYKLRKLMTNWPAYGMFTFHFYRWNQLSHSPGQQTVHWERHSSTSFRLR